MEAADEPDVGAAAAGRDVAVTEGKPEGRPVGRLVGTETAGKPLGTWMSWASEPAAKATMMAEEVSFIMMILSRKRLESIREGNVMCVMDLHNLVEEERYDTVLLYLASKNLVDERKRWSPFNCV